MFLAPSERLRLCGGRAARRRVSARGLGPRGPPAGLQRGRRTAEATQPGRRRRDGHHPQQDGPAPPCAAATPGPAPGAPTEHSGDYGAARAGHIPGGRAFPEFRISGRSRAASLHGGSLTSTDSQHVTKQYTKQRRHWLILKTGGRAARGA